MKKNKLTVEAAVSFLLFLSGVFLIATAARLPMSSGVTDYGGPGTFPFWISVLMTLLAAIQTVREYLKSASAVRGGIERQDIIRVVLLIAVCIIYVFIIELTGYIIATVLCLAAVLWLFGFRHKLWMPVISVAVPVLLYFLFRNLFSVQLP